MLIKSNKRVIFDHDGGIDDLLSLMLLLTMPHIELLGITITPADCYAEDAVETTLKLLSLFDRRDVPVSVGTRYGPNPFPAEWRAQPRFCKALPTLLRVSSNDNQLQSQSAHSWMMDILSSNQNVTVLMTGPASNLAQALEERPQIKTNIDEVIWMGGAINVKGNVAMHDHDGSAEWNAYWDPKATFQLLEHELPLLLVPLDATNALPVDWRFLEQLAAANTPLTDLAGQFWAATVTSIPTYEFTYFMWDVLATALLGLPSEAYQMRSAKVCSSTAAPNAGQIWQSTCKQAVYIKWLSDVNAKNVIDYVINAFANAKLHL